jgi:hypothetical protein
MDYKRYADLGKLLCADFPEVAERLTVKLLKNIPVIIDQSYLYDIFRNYCESKEIEPESVTGAGREKTYHKHVFISVIVKLYSPGSFNHTRQILPKNLRKNLSEILETKGERISEAICDVRVRLKAYEDFSKDVTEFYTQTLNYLAENENNNIRKIAD